MNFEFYWVLNGYALRTVIVLFFLGNINLGLFAQANDLCGNAEAVFCGSTVMGNTLGATTTGAGGFCGTNPTAGGVWYVLSGDGLDVTASTCNSASYDTKINVYSGSCGTLTCITGNDDTSGCSGFTSEVTFSTIPGTDYYIYVNGFGASQGMFALSIDCFAPPTPPVNDLCANAIEVTCGSVTAGSTVVATFDAAPFCGTSNTASGVWYRLTGDGSDLAVASTCNDADYDTKISVYTGSCGALSCVAGNDDGVGCSGFSSEASFSTTSGVEYYILVHGFGTATGSFNLTVECIGPPANDNACTPQFLVTGVVTPFSNFLATVEPGEPSPGAGSGVSSCDSNDGWCSFETGVQTSVWFRFFSTSPCVNVSTAGFNTQLAIWATNDCGNFGSYTLVGANDDGAGSASSVDIEVTPYTPYYVQIDGFGGAQGDGTVLVTEQECPEECENFGLTLSITLDNLPAETTWELRTDGGDVVQTGGPYSTAGATVVEQLCSDVDCYEFEIFDSSGDGICCGFGNGSYSLTDVGGNILASGGAFGASETTSFCTSCEVSIGAPWASTDIGSANGDSYFDSCEGTYMVESSGFSTPFVDKQHFVYQELCGNASITARVADFIGIGGYAGIQMRETLVPGAKKVGLETQLLNLIRREIRIQSNFPAQSLQFPAFSNNMWLRITRTNFGFGDSDYFVAEFSADGSSWTPILQSYILMSNCIYVGMYSEGTNINATSVGVFSDVSVTGSAPGPLSTPEVTGANAVAGHTDQITELSVFPNPATEEINIKMGKFLGQEVKINVLNKVGQSIYSRQIDSVEETLETIDVSALPSGMYYLNVITNDRLINSKKFIVKSSKP